MQWSGRRISTCVREQVDGVAPNASGAQPSSCPSIDGPHMGAPVPLGKGPLWLAGQPVEVGKYGINKAFQPDIAPAGGRIEQAEEVARLVGGLRPAFGRMCEHAALQLLLATAQTLAVGLHFGGQP